MQVANGTTDVTTYFVLRDSTNHAPKTDVTITDIDLYYIESGAAMAAKVDATALAAADSAHSDNAAYHVGQGLYRIDWPDAAFDGGVGKVVNLIVVCSGVDTTFLEVELVGVAQTGDSYARLGAPAGASVSADIADLPTVAEFEARTLVAADYTVVGDLPAAPDNAGIAAIQAKTDNLPADPAGVSDLPSVPSAGENATAAAAAILATPANKLATDASGRVTPDAVTPATNVSALALEATAQAILTDTSTTLPAAITSAAANVSVDEIQPTALADLFNTNSGTTYAAAVAGSPVKEIADNAGAGGVTVTASVQLSAAQANAVNSGDLAISTHHALAQTITSTSANALDARVLVLAVKQADDDADTAALVLISTDVGLEYLAGAAYATPAHGSLTVGGIAGDWDIAVALDGTATALLTPYAVHSYPAELKDLTSDTAIWTGLALIGRGLVQMLS